MIEDVTHCSDCHFWGDKPVVGEDGRSWARCKNMGGFNLMIFIAKMEKQVPIWKPEIRNGENI